MSTRPLVLAECRVNVLTSFDIERACCRGSSLSHVEYTSTSALFGPTRKDGKPKFTVSSWGRTRIGQRAGQLGREHHQEASQTIGSKAPTRLA